MFAHSVRRPHGYARISDPGIRGGTQEADTLLCGHCSAVIHVGEITTGQAGPGGCYQCGEPLCGVCVTVGICRPFELWLDVHEGKPAKGRWAESFTEFRRRVGG